MSETKTKAKPKARQKSKAESIQYLTPDELKRLLSVIERKRDKALFLLAYRHGLRSAEVGMLQTGDIDYKKLRIRINRLKGSNPSDNILQPDEARLLKAYLKERNSDSPYVFTSNRGLPIAPRTLRHLMKDYGEWANLPAHKRHFHVLKHSIATHLISAGADILFIKEWLGHANIQNTMIYTQLVSTARDAKARALFTKLPRF